MANKYHRGVYVKGMSAESEGGQVCSGIHYGGMVLLEAMTYGEVNVAGYSGGKQDHATRLRRIEGQVRGLQRMVDEDKYCIDILTQVSAATSALKSFSLSLLEEHLEHCVAEATQKGGPEADAKVKEASEAIARLVRS